MLLGTHYPYLNPYPSHLGRVWVNFFNPIEKIRYGPWGVNYPWVSLQLK